MIPWMLLTVGLVTSQSLQETQDKIISTTNVSDILNSFQIGYDRRVRPNYGGSPVTVGVTLYVLDIGEVSEKFMDFTFDMYFRQFWRDERLRFQKKEGLDKLVVGADYVKLIWIPDTFFVNEKVARFHMATQENQFLRINSEGEILRSMRLTVKATCPMNLLYFPMDSQLCTLLIESYGYTMTDLIYEWNDGLFSVKMSPDLQLNRFDVRGFRQRRVVESLTSGNYSRLLADILFDRSMGYYLIQVYIPSSLIVAMSWVSFWLDRGSAPARVGLGVTTVLTMVTLMGAVNRSLPKISYMKALDIYLFVCFFMVFGALLEYAMVGYTSKRILLQKRLYEDFKMKVEKMKEELKKREEEDRKREEENLIDIEEHRHSGHSNYSWHSKTCRFKRREHSHDRLKEVTIDPRSPIPSTVPSLLDDQPPTRIFGVKAGDIDRYSRFIFPITFTGFHFFYWTILISISNYPVDDLIALHSK